jgi:hypothetical protein
MSKDLKNIYSKHAEDDKKKQKMKKKAERNLEKQTVS